MDEREQVPVEVRFGFLTWFVIHPIFGIHPIFAELFPWPFPTVPITVNLGAAIRPDDSWRTPRRPELLRSIRFEECSRLKKLKQDLTLFCREALAQFQKALAFWREIITFHQIHHGSA